MIASIGCMSRHDDFQRCWYWVCEGERRWASMACRRRTSGRPRRPTSPPGAEVALMATGRRLRPLQRGTAYMERCALDALRAGGGAAIEPPGTLSFPCVPAFSLLRLRHSSS